MNEPVINPGNNPVNPQISDLVTQAMIRAGISTQADSPLTTASTFAMVYDAMNDAGLMDAPPIDISPEPEVAPVVVPEPTDSWLTVGSTVLFSIAVAVALVVLNPPRLIDSFDVFSTPLHVIPEWYLLPAFGIVLAAPSKLLGLATMAGVLGFLFALPFLPNLGKWVARSAFVALHLGVVAIGWMAMGQ